MNRIELVTAMAKDLVIAGRPVKEAFTLAETFYAELEVRRAELKKINADLGISADWVKKKRSDFNEEYTAEVGEKFILSLFEDSREDSKKEVWHWTVEIRDYDSIFDSEEEFDSRQDAEKNMAETIVPDLEALLNILRALGD